MHYCVLWCYMVWARPHLGLSQLLPSLTWLGAPREFGVGRLSNLCPVGWPRPPPLKKLLPLQRMHYGKYKTVGCSMKLSMKYTMVWYEAAPAASSALCRENTIRNPSGRGEGKLWGWKSRRAGSAGQVSVARMVWYGMVRYCTVWYCMV